MSRVSHAVHYGLMLIGFLGACLLAGAAPGAAAPGRSGADPNPASIHGSRGAWPMYRQWNAAEVRHFAAWIENIYLVKREGTPEQRLAKLERALTDPELNLLLDPAFAGEPSNPQLDAVSIQAIHNVLDCGKLTIVLTGYYAYRRGLPFMVSRIRSGDGTDIRSSAFNVVTGGASNLDYASPGAFLVDAVYGFCTGNYRIDPDHPTAELSDTAPLALDRNHLLPGTLFYMDGHVMIVGHVDAYGEVYFLDATVAPSRDIYSHHGLTAANGVTAMQEDGRFSGCYRGFRVQRFPVAEVDASGRVTNVRRRTDEEMKAFGYSTEQYEVMRQLIAQNTVVEDGIPIGSFHKLVRYRMRTAEQINPSLLLAAYADRLTDMFHEREARVQAGWREVQQNGPIVFPERGRVLNIFNAPGRWGQWSTASLDADLRASYRYMTIWLEGAVQWYPITPEYVDLSALNRDAIVTEADLAYALIQEKKRVFGARVVHYANSNGDMVPLTLLDLERRLFDLSFDPNHPPELRWGAPQDSAEAQTIVAIDTPLPDGGRVPMHEAYRRQTFYRTLSYRDTDESYLRDMFVEGFPIPARFNDQLALWLRIGASPPLVPVQRS